MSRSLSAFDRFTRWYLINLFLLIPFFLYALVISWTIALLFLSKAISPVFCRTVDASIKHFVVYSKASTPPFSSVDFFQLQMTLYQDSSESIIAGCLQANFSTIPASVFLFLLPGFSTTFTVSFSAMISGAALTFCALCLYLFTNSFSLPQSRYILCLFRWD